MTLVRRTWLMAPALLCTAVVVSHWAAAASGQTAAVPPHATSEPVGNAAPAADVSAAKPKDRPAAVAALAARLGIGEGSAVADIGAGKGQDTWVFAHVVGESGTVYAEEITEKFVKSLQAEAEKRKLPQVRPVLGRSDDPGLPREAIDLAYMRYVYHHIAKPREMLRGIWRALKPGGYFVVIDRRLGTLQDWGPREEREEKHFWTAETTVVREAREEGFSFVACAEDCCESADPFVLVFQRPRALQEPGSDPDVPWPLAKQEVLRQLLPQNGRNRHSVFIALGKSRKLMAPILERSSGQGLEIVLEEWATQKNERPLLPAGISLPSVLTDRGDPRLGPEPIDAVYFLDSYHLLFHGKVLLARLHEKLAADGLVYVLDREAKRPLSRRDASHHRQIDPQVVKQEMAAAGFCLRREGVRPAADRFLLVFGKCKPEVDAVTK